MTVLITAESAVLALLVLLVAGLLRSHADILRALHDLGAGLGDEHRSASSTAVDAPRRAPLLRAPAEHRRLPDVLQGETLEGEAASIGTGAEGSTLIAFLSSGCGTCAGFWAALGSGAQQALTGTRVVVVTRDRAEESPSALAGMAPAGVTVLMSSRAWDDLAVPGSPYFVHLDHGTVTGEGTASTWPQLLSLVAQAQGDGRAPRAGSPWSTDAEREARADRDLAAAGILPGDPRLYPGAGGASR